MNNVYRIDRSACLLILSCLVQLMVTLDGLIVTVALPQIRDGLGLGAAGQQWIVDGYLISLGGLLLVGARAADVFGHRVVLLAGITLFAAASLVAGLAPDGSSLIAARLVQGAGAAALAPGSLSLLTASFAGADRPRAVAIWSATSGAAGAFGLVLGGVITSALGWRWVLFVNVPIGMLLVALTLRAVPAGRPAPAVGGRRLDLGGALTVSTAVAALTYALSQTSQQGWGSPRVTASVAVGVVAMLAFGLVERVVAAPLLTAAVLGRRSVLMGNAAVAVLGAIMTSTVYFLSLYLQRGRHESPALTGLILVPMSVVLTAGALRAREWMARVGARRLVIVGGTLMAAGLLALAVVVFRGDGLLPMVGATVLWAGGACVVTMPCVSVATRDVPTQDAGLASGLVNTTRQVGGAVGLAALAAVADASTDVSHSYAVAFGVAAVVALFLAVTAGLSRPR